MNDPGCGKVHRPELPLLGCLRHRLADRGSQARTFSAELRDIGFLDVAVAANEFRGFCQRYQTRPVLRLRLVEMAEDDSGILAGQRPLHPALGRVAERIECRSTQGLEPRQDPERAKNPGAEFALAQMPG